jgi:hypothetical protein
VAGLVRVASDRERPWRPVDDRLEVEDWRLGRQEAS